MRYAAAFSERGSVFDSTVETAKREVRYGNKL